MLKKHDTYGRMVSPRQDISKQPGFIAVIVFTMWKGSLTYREQLQDLELGAVLQVDIMTPGFLPRKL